jgi:four helix bundle protein
MVANSAKELRVYQQSYALAMEIFDLSKAWPKEETDQVRRSSRSVCANLKEVWAKRRYVAHFISKRTDADTENSETGT